MYFLKKVQPLILGLLHKRISVLPMFSQEYLKYKWRNENHDYDISFLFN